MHNLRALLLLSIVGGCAVPTHHGAAHTAIEAPPRAHSLLADSVWRERLDRAAHEYWRIRAHADLAKLGIEATRYDPTTSDVPLALKMQGGRIRTDFDPHTALAKGEVVDITGRWDPTSGDDNPTLGIRGKLFLQLTMRLDDQKRLFAQYPQRNYLPIPEDSRRVLDFRDGLDIIGLGMHDYNRDNSHIWPGIPHSYLYAPVGTPYDPDNPPTIHGDGFPYIQRAHLTLARREVPMPNSEYASLLGHIDALRGRGPISIRYDMGDGVVDTVEFDQVWLKINPYDGRPAHLLKTVRLK